MRQPLPDLVAVACLPFPQPVLNSRDVSNHAFEKRKVTTRGFMNGSLAQVSTSRFQDLQSEWCLAPDLLAF